MQSGFLRHIKICTNHDASKFLSFFIGDIKVGEITHETAQIILQHNDFILVKNGIALNPALNNFHSRSSAFANAALFLSHNFQAKPCNEMYPVLQNWGGEIFAEIDRVAVPWFGVRGYGVHVNGFVRKNNCIHVWIAERAMDRRIDPGKLDNLIGGGLPIGLTIEKNLAKEAKEEAGIDEQLALTAKPEGSLSYKVDMMHGLRNDTLFIFDLELPEDYLPRNTDGEVASFKLIPLPEVAEIIRTTDRFKFNCNLVIIDFMLRHGFIDKSHDEFAPLTTELKTIRSNLG